MTKTLSRLGALALAALVAGPLAAQQTTDNRVGANTDWSVFQETDPAECFAVSAPKSQENTRDGQRVEVSRGETLLFVFYRPGEGVNGQVTFTGGYPFASNSTVTLEVAGSQFTLFTEEEWAWPASPEEDARIVAALKGGSEAVLTGQSGRGTVTRDTFSLLGFTASVTEAQTRCAS
jgi:hypothetical protein